MSRSLVVAAVQTMAHDRTSFARVWPAIADRIREAAGLGAQLIVLPEATLPGYVMGFEAYDGAEIAQALDECSRLARELRVVLVIGAARRDGDRVFNSAMVIDADGSIAGTADKHFLWHFDRQWFAAGERLQPVDTSIGAIGALVCADGRIPTIARTLVDRGAELLVMPTAWVTSGRDPQQLENVQADLLARVRARENNVPFVAANKAGIELGCVAYCGKSQIVTAGGELAAVGPEDREKIVLATIQIGASRAVRHPDTDGAAGGRIESGSTPVRIAISARAFADDALTRERLRILEADVLIMPENIYAAGERAVQFVRAGDDAVGDPGYLAARRLAGYDLAVWRSDMDPQWQLAFARARALELRIYVIVADTARGRAFAVDPDGVVLCGTFDGYEIASFTYDPLRTRQTLVAPGTDVLAGLQRADQHART
jgi:predicted amidohydrolase